MAEPEVGLAVTQRSRRWPGAAADND